MLVPGAHRLELDAGRVVLTLFFSDIKLLRELRLAADAIYLDGFSPARNPDMWSHALLRAVSRLAGPGATAATWSVAAPVRAALEAAGFAVEKAAGFGNKKEMLVAKNIRRTEPPRKTPRSATVIGAGLAGAAICERLCARGWQVRLMERHAIPAQEASGNHAGSFHPLVTPDDSVFARLTRCSFLYGLSRWRKLESVRWDRCGVLQLARDAKDEASQRASIAALALPAGYAQYVTREEASAHAGVPVEAAGLWFPEAGWIQPQSLVNAQLEACGERLERIFGTEVKTLEKGAPVILATANDSLSPVPHARLRRVRGQLTYIRAGAIEPPRAVVLRGGMVLPPVDGLCVVGASFDLDDADPAPRASSHAGNLERLQRIISAKTKPQPLEGRVAFRTVAPDRLPLVGELAEGVYGALAYGSRGLRDTGEIPGHEAREKELLRKDGSRVWVAVATSLARGKSGEPRYFISVVHDISEAKRATAALRESEERFRRTFELAGSGVAHIGMDRRFVRVNRRLCEMTGYSEGELLRLTGRQISHPEDVDVINAKRPGLYAGEDDAARLDYH